MRGIICKFTGHPTKRDFSKSMVPNSAWVAFPIENEMELIPSYDLDRRECDIYIWDPRSLEFVWSHHERMYV